ncbi:MAG: hypothetical protein M5U25_09520 [Planctomycetota bacterium]|nr:hypothetical protein [Planctomycetota bacterium]
MERVTYPSTVVTSVLNEGYIRQLLDVEDDSELTKLFQPDAIPVAIVLNAEGLELGRKVGFVEPDEYAKWLESFRN